MNAFDTAAVLLAIAAICGYLNHRLLRLPAASGTLAVALMSSMALVAVETLAPAWTLRDRVGAFLDALTMALLIAVLAQAGRGLLTWQTLKSKIRTN